MRTRTVAAGVVAGTALAVSTVFGVGTAHAASDTDAIAAAATKLHEAGINGVIVATSDGDADWRTAVGVADTATGRKMRPDFQHRIGSVTKTFTAVALLRQVEAGHLDLDDPVGRYLPKLLPGERGRQVTVRMLLDHTSGIGNYTDVVLGGLDTSVDAYERNRYRTWSARELARIGLELEPTGEPGAEKSYSNTNYVLAGLVLQRVTGEDAQRNITREVIDRAGLRDTYFPGRDPRIDGPHSKMYFTNTVGQRGEYSVYNMTWAGTAGSLVSTAADQSRFVKALLGGELLGAEQLAVMRDGGLALTEMELGGCQVTATSGSIPGADSFVVFDSTGDRTVVIETNTSDMSAGAGEEILDAYLGLIDVAAREIVCPD